MREQDKQFSLPSLYQHFIFISRYSRWLENEKRRETWEETVDRYFTFFEEHFSESEKEIKIGKSVKDELRNAILNLEIMPSMRTLMTAGEALKRNNMAGYNCSAVAVSNIRAFSEGLLVLLHGTGLGFSVEQHFVDKLPTIAEEFHNSDTTVVVEDSKCGWSKAYKELISLLVGGQIPRYDLSKIRPAGSRLKTFGGRASGPKPLEDLFLFTTNIFKNAAGRKLSSIECHDIMCMIGSCVVVGGVRRSALISLSNLTDEKMREAKSGAWWNENPQRALANNSVAYKEKPEIGVFMDEWISLYKSKSGERGIFNRQSAKRSIEKLGDRREANHDWLVNPCVSKDMMISTNRGLRSVESLIGVPFIAVCGGEYSSTGFMKTGTKKLFKVSTEAGYQLRATNNHRLLMADGSWKELGNCSINDELTIGNTRIHHKINQDEYDLGWLVGEVIGDGCYNPDKYIALVRFWGETKSFLANKAYDIIESISTTYNQPTKPKAPVVHEKNGTEQVQSKKIDTLCRGQIDFMKNILPKLEQMPVSFVAGVISGLFDSDGTVGGDPKNKGIYLQLTSVKPNNLHCVQRMLMNFGITSRIYKTRDAGNTLLPNGNGGNSIYETQELYRLDIGRDNLDLFQKYIGFTDPNKKERLEKLLSLRSRPAYRPKFSSKIVSIEEDGIEDVYDCSVPEIERFVCNGLVVHNCGEILLRDRETCNLTEVIVRPNDTKEDLVRKIRLATILGTWQASLTNFPQFSSEWKKNAEEEALLGVSLTGILDNPILFDKNHTALGELLVSLKEVAIQTNKEWAKKIGINHSAAITTIKPSGTVSNLVDTASGIHPRHSEHYIRTVRADNRDPLCTMMKELGFPNEPCVMKPEYTTVFSFPQSAVGSVTRKDMTAIEHLELWLTYKTYWTEHNPSITVTIKEHEWMEVGAWVYKNFNNICGVSFLPEDKGTYRQAPYQDCTKEDYELLVAKMPKNVDWNLLKEYEKEDATAGSQTLACTAGSCELVDLTTA